MTKLVSALSDLVMLSQDPVHGALRAQILPFIEQTGIHLGRGLIAKPLLVESAEHRVSLLRG
jgi:hypothetical protein